MSAPFPKPVSWRDRLRTVAILFGLWLLVCGCNRGVEAWQAAAQRRRAAPYLEVANPLRRRLGLVPVSANFKPPRYLDLSGHDGTERVVYDPRATPGVCVFNAGKTLIIDVDTGDLTAEEDTFWFTDPDTTARDTPHYYFLRWQYSFVKAAAHRQPWRVWLSDKDLDVAESGAKVPVHILNLTRAQADSVLRSWHQLGRQDSLARVGRAAK